MTGFYRNMATGDYDEYRDTDEVGTPRQSRNKKPEQNMNRRRFTSEDLRPVGEQDDEY